MDIYRPSGADQLPAAGSRRRHSVAREPYRFGRTLVRTILLGTVLTLLAACGGGGGKDVTIGSGESDDPVALDFPVFYVKRPVPEADDQAASNDDARRLLRFDIGADLFMRDRASPSADEINLTGSLTEGLGDVRDVNVNFDGTKVLFAMRAKFIEGADEVDQPTWDIWEYDVKTKSLHRIMASDTTAGEGHDIMPHYLPDGRIVFSSTRQRQSRAILLDENKPQYAGQVERSGNAPNPAFLLHVMDADGGNIHQISFNQSHDLNPAVLGDGRIVYTRWEQARDDDQMDLYTVNPDGTGLQLLYGANSHATGTVDPATQQPSNIQFLQPRTLADGRTLALIRPYTGTFGGGDLVLIDTANYVDNTRGGSVANAGLAGPAQTRVPSTEVRTFPGPSPGGRFRSASALFDGTNRLLVSWSQCRLIENGSIVPCTTERLNDQATPPVEAPPLYGIYIYDVRDNTQKPIVAPQEGFIYTEVVAGSSRTSPAAIADVIPDANLLAEGVGILHIRSVYDVDGTDTVPGGIGAVRDPANPAYATRPARFLRIEKAVSQPDNLARPGNVPDTAFGPDGRRLGMSNILGYAPIEPDGSVKVKVPANMAFSISVLDANGRRLGGVLGNRHRNWLQVMPGETLECNGCHNPNANPPLAHGRAGLTASANPGAPTTGVAFPNTNPLLAPFDMGETMAQARSRVMCGTTQACAPSVDVAFPVDYWPAPSIAPAAAFDMCYAVGPSSIPAGPADPATPYTCVNGLATPAPVSAACGTRWNSLCRVSIHYPTHIHPLWSRDRRVFDQVSGAQLADNTCTSCHNTADAAGTPQVPAGQLDLTDGAADDPPDQLRAYRELLFTGNEQILDNGALIDRQVQVGVDPVTGAPQFATVPIEPPMSAAGARASAAFFDKFDQGGGTVNHQGWLSPSELRLIAEWLDIGAQYYNDPFVAPVN